MGDQREEIKTIKERTLKLRLSDADCDRISRRAGMHGLTVAELLENFIGDLVGGTYTNGSTERDYADRWFCRCWFGMFPENTLLHHLLESGYDPENYLDTLENIADGEADKKRAEEHPEEYNEEELSYIDDDIEDWQAELKEYTKDWEPEKELNMQEEIEMIKKWVNEVNNLKESEVDEKRKDGTDHTE